MANTQALKRRVRSVSNTKQITKAMELVAAAKLRRVQAAAVAARAYNEAAMTILRRLAQTPDAAQAPYFNSPPAKNKLYVIFNSDRGLAGAYNANVFAAAARSFTQDSADGVRPQVISFGRKGARHFARGTNVDLIGEYVGLDDVPHMNVFAPVIETISTGFQRAQFKAVVLIFTQSVSTMTQQVQTLQLLPVQPYDSAHSSNNPQADPSMSNGPSTESTNEMAVVYEFEPDTEIVMKDAIRLYFEASLRRAKVEAAASEHAMRMMSMGNANRNAAELIDDLTLELNATRQASITQEVAEIIGGASAIAS